MIQPLLTPHLQTDDKKASSSDSAARRNVLSVAQLANKIRRTVENDIGLVWINGEISNLTIARSGHWYFTLKDEQAQLKCAMFSGKNRSARFTPKDGQHVILRAKASVYEARGDLQLIGESIELAGDGALQVAFAELKRRLNADGLFDQNVKQAIPTHPKRIGVVTSATGAAIRDVLSVLKRRAPNIPVIVYPCLVQGTSAPAQIIKQIEIANERNECDVLLVTRGGGSLEDLWAFNDENLAQVIFNSDIPIVSAVGHEVDTTVSDYVADLRAPTPSAAAELLVPNQRDVLLKINALQQKLKREAEHVLLVAQSRLDRLIPRIKHPKHELSQKSHELHQLSQRLHHSLTEQLQQHSHKISQLNGALKPQLLQQSLSNLQLRLQHAQQSMDGAVHSRLNDSRNKLGFKAQQLNDFSPLSTLNRGYSITLSKKGVPLTSVEQAKKEDELITRFKDGVIKSFLSL